MMVNSCRLVATVLWLTTLTLVPALDTHAQDAFFDEGNQLYQNDDFAGARLLELDSIEPSCSRGWIERGST